METPAPRYSEAMERLQVLVQELESGRLDIDDMLARVQEAEELVAYCRLRLRDAGGSMEELIGRLKTRS